MSRWTLEEARAFKRVRARPRTMLQWTRRMLKDGPVTVEMRSGMRYTLTKVGTRYAYIQEIPGQHTLNFFFSDVVMVERAHKSG